MTSQLSITAAKARELAGKTVGEKVHAIGERIRELATEKKRSLRCGYDYSADQDLWINGGYGQTPEWKEAVAMLEKAGFQVSFYYAEHQFVDMYTLIEW